MRKIVTALFGGLLFAGTCAAGPGRGVKGAAPAPDGSGAHLRLEETSWNFGDVPRRGGDLVHEFRFVNDGTKPLVLVRVVTSCSCIRTSFPKRPVAPADSGVIRVVYEPHKSEPGAFNKVIQIYSNSVDGRDLLTVQGNSLDGEEPRKVRTEREKVKKR